MLPIKILLEDNCVFKNNKLGLNKQLIYEFENQTFKSVVEVVGKIGTNGQYQNLLI